MTSKEYLYYLNNRNVDMVSDSTMLNLIKDAYTIKDIVDWVPADRVRSELQKEYDDLCSIIEAIEAEIFNRLSDKYKDEDDFNDKYEELKADNTYCYLDWMHWSRFTSIDSVHKGYIKDMYRTLYHLYDFFADNEKPANNKKNKLNEYEFCEKLMDALERTIYVRLSYLRAK